jgi:hypothetical protein
MLDKGSGALSKYANTYATTAISQYAGENNKILTDDLGLEWFEYVGSNIETTREFCEHLTEKRYIHKSEIKTILKGDIDGFQCAMNEKTRLPKGQKNFPSIMSRHLKEKYSNSSTFRFIM